MKTHNYAVFPSIITEVQCSCFDHIQHPLLDWIYDYKKDKSGVIISNRGGWQSKSDFWREESFSHYFNYIFDHIKSSVRFYNLNFEMGNMWININKKGNYNFSHIHPLSLLSGVMWIKSPQNCGDLIFESPHNFNEGELLEKVDVDFREKTNYFNTFKFEPIPGKIVLFPSHLRHCVDESRSDEDRVSIAFNLITKFKYGF